MEFLTKDRTSCACIRKLLVFVIPERLVERLLHCRDECHANGGSGWKRAENEWDVASVSNRSVDHGSLDEGLSERSRLGTPVQRSAEKSLGSPLSQQWDLCDLLRVVGAERCLENRRAYVVLSAVQIFSHKRLRQHHSVDSAGDRRPVLNPLVSDSTIITINLM